MSISVTFNSTHRVSLASEFFLARRPVVGRAQELVAHELLFCGSRQTTDTAPEQRPASAPVIADVCRHGIARVLGDLPGLLYLDADALMSDLFEFLPADRVVFELPPLDDPAAHARMAELMRAGFRFALVAERDDEWARALLPLVMGVRIDVAGKSRAELAPLCATFRAAGKHVLAERVDTPQMFELCRDIGFDFFQGCHFAIPRIDIERPLSVSELAVMELMAMIASDADSSEIEHCIKRDVALGLKMLRMANAPAFGHRSIDSIRQALMVVGRAQLQRWLQLMLYADSGGGRPMLALLAMAATRARLMELAAQKLRPANRGVADSAFSVGIMSLMDTLFSKPMDEILQQMPVGEEVAAALLTREGYLGKLLSLAEYAEWTGASEGPLRLLLAELKLGFGDLYALQLDAFEWSDSIARHAHS